MQKNTKKPSKHQKKIQRRKTIIFSIIAGIFVLTTVLSIILSAVY